MKAKLKGGPMHNQSYELETTETNIVVSRTDSINWRQTNLDDLVLSVAFGDYRASNTKQKNGTVIYQWMGWRE